MKKKRNKKTKENLPGYPHYPETEDITNMEKRLDVEVENLSASPGAKNSDLKELPPGKKRRKKSGLGIVPGTEADVTKEDLVLLGRKDRDADDGEDETLLPGLKTGPDFTGDDLDVPGSELDDNAENIGSEDEENNYYSRGQD